MPQPQQRKYTLVIVRRVLTLTQAALTVVLLETSFVRFRKSMTLFNEERTSPLPFGWDPVAMVRTRGICEEAVWRRGSEEERRSMINRWFPGRLSPSWKDLSAHILHTDPALRCPHVVSLVYAQPASATFQPSHHTSLSATPTLKIPAPCQF